LRFVWRRRFFSSVQSRDRRHINFVTIFLV
jgi:hypothetical protein